MLPARSLRIALLSPRGPLYRHRTGIWKKSLRYMPLTLTTLAALIPPELKAEVRLLDEGIDDIDMELEADLVGISAITGTAPRAYELAGHFRRRGLPVVLGGPHPTLMPDEAAEHADAVVTGYAEETWPQLLRDFVAGRMLPRYTQSPSLSLASMPMPRRELLPAGRFVTAHTIEATRGCIHQCEFCVVPTAWGRPIKRPVGEVVAEIKAMNTRRLLFLDLNLINDVDYAKELFRAVEPLRLQWGGLTTTLLAWDDELLDLAARSGCRGLLLGFETLSDDSLGEVRKGFNQKKGYFELVRRLHERSIAIMGCFVFGFDHDTKDTFREVAEFAIDAGIDLPRYAIITPFPGTPLFKRLDAEGRILTRDWSLYDAQHVVFRPAQMSVEELQLGTEWAWKETYRFSSIARRLGNSRTMLGVAVPANLGYRFYARNLHRYYHCREALL
ncbi:MAG TPA: radical SAM protein [Symbiobacteriaceae bacterium]|nr:radical SAM protein [Symbiobacteriaceae bacterium]